ncbi:hypothetical protein J3F83DRAFT_24824 [Trichoderma novae-zelandiae]
MAHATLCRASPSGSHFGSTRSSVASTRRFAAADAVGRHCCQLTPSRTSYLREGCWYPDPSKPSSSLAETSKRTWVAGIPSLAMLQSAPYSPYKPVGSTARSSGSATMQPAPLPAAANHDDDSARIPYQVCAREGHAPTTKLFTTVPHRYEGRGLTRPTECLYLLVDGMKRGSGRLLRSITTPAISVPRGLPCSAQPLCFDSMYGYEPLEPHRYGFMLECVSVLRPDQNTSVRLVRHADADAVVVCSVLRAATNHRPTHHHRRSRWVATGTNCRHSLCLPSLV